MGARRSGERGERYDAIHCVGGIAVDGDTVLGSDDSAVVTINARLLVRQVDDLGMTGTAGTAGELVYNTVDKKVYFCTRTDDVAADWSNADITGDVALVGSLVCGGTLEVHGDTTLKRGLYVGGSSAFLGGLTVEGNVLLGLGTDSIITCFGSFQPRQVTVPDMTEMPGLEGELVFNTTEAKLYVCTEADETAATWAALN